MLTVCIGKPCFHLLIQKHAVVYFSIICKLIKENSFFFPYKIVYCMAKKVATYSEYLVEVDFFKNIYTH